jgi:hypothetical protein
MVRTTPVFDFLANFSAATLSSRISRTVFSGFTFSFLSAELSSVTKVCWE